MDRGWSGGGSRLPTPLALFWKTVDGDHRDYTFYQIVHFIYDAISNIVNNILYTVLSYRHWMIIFYFILIIDYVALYALVHYIEWHFVTLYGIAWPHMTLFGTTLSHITVNDTTPLYMILYDSIWGCMTTMRYYTTHVDIEWLYRSLDDTSWWLYIIIWC